MRRLIIVLGCITAGPVQAGCTEVDVWRFGVAPFGFIACGTGLGEGGVAFRHCRKPYPYRDPAAEAEFQRLNAEIAACLGQGIAAPEDAAVNHPDSYDLRQYALENGVLSLSLKDKGALGATLIFLRMEDGG